MKCPKCNQDMQEQNGKFGPFLFCPNQYTCGQRTITISRTSSQSKPVSSSSSLLAISASMEAGLTGMAAVAYENDEDWIENGNHAQIDNNKIALQGTFSDMHSDDNDDDDWTDYCCQ